MPWYHSVVLVLTTPWSMHESKWKFRRNNSHILVLEQSSWSLQNLPNWQRKLTIWQVFRPSYKTKIITLQRCVISWRKNFRKLRAPIANSTNPFAQSEDCLFKLVSKVLMPEEIKLDLCAQRAEGDKPFRTFVMKHIQERRENLWSPRKKGELQTWTKATKKKNTEIVVNKKILELREDRCLFSRLFLDQKLTFKTS